LKSIIQLINIVILKVRLVASGSVVSIAPFCHCSNDSTYLRRHRLTDDRWPICESLFWPTLYMLLSHNGLTAVMIWLTFDFAMTLTFDLCFWKPFRQCLLAQWILHAKFHSNPFTIVKRYRITRNCERTTDGRRNKQTNKGRQTTRKHLLMSAKAWA